MEIRNYIAILWRRKWVVFATAAVTVIIVVIGTLLATPTYTASAMVRVATAAGGSVDYTDYIYAERLMNTYAELASIRPVLEELAQKLGLQEPPQIVVEVVASTELMRITVEDPNPLLAREAADALAEILVAQSTELYSGGGKTAEEILSEQLAQIEQELNKARGEYDELLTQFPEDSERIATVSRSIELKQQTYATLLGQYEQARVRGAMRANTLSVVEPATTPDAPSKPRKLLNIALSLLVGLAGGAGLAFLFENLDTTLYTTQQIEEVAALSSVGRIPTARRQGRVFFFNGSSPQGEAFRRLRINVFALDHDAAPQTLLVTSASPREGKSTIAANLALAVAQSGHRVVTVDGDLRRPTLHRIFDLPNDVGLSSVLKQETTLDEGLEDSGMPGVWVLTSGPLPLNPVELLGSPQMITLIEQLAQQFDMVLLDTPALLAVTDAAVLAPIVDGVILVVGRTQARREAVRAACQQLADVKARLVGVVVNRAEQDGTYEYYLHTPNRRG
jgi:capsular exopolysaccharide synthesis family protein